MAEGIARHSACQFKSEKQWLNHQCHPNGTIIKPEELQTQMQDPPNDIPIDDEILDRIHGSMIGMSLGDALGAFVEFRPHDYMVEHPVITLKGGGTWGLKKGQFTDDTSMAICLANSLVARRDHVPYDQLVRYKWWYRNGYMSSTGNCFDIGAATRKSLVMFENRQKEFAEKHKIPLEHLDYLADPALLKKFNVNCSEEGVAGNGPLMRLAPVPLFFYQHPTDAVRYSGDSGKITHGDKKATDACRYYGALIVAALLGESRNQLLDTNFYTNHTGWFGEETLHPDILNIAQGSYQKNGYAGGIRGKGYVVDSLEAALWAFWSDEGEYRKGVLAAINLGDDTDTTAAIYGQLAGAYYGYKKLPEKWVKEIYAKDFIACLSKWIAYEGKKWSSTKTGGASPIAQKTDLDESWTEIKSVQKQPQNTDYYPTTELESDLHQPSTDKASEVVDDSIKLYFNEKINSSQDVRQWIESLGEDYVEEAVSLEHHNIDGYWLLNHITDENLQNYGVQRADHRQVLLNHIAELKNQNTTEVVSPQE